jgi:hypothetical protein
MQDGGVLLFLPSGCLFGEQTGIKAILATPVDSDYRPAQPL